MSELTPADYDTVVVGAGPAGAMAALKAAERGPVLLVEAKSLPRDKSCGGMLHEYSRNILSRIAEIPEEIVLEPRYVNFRYHDWNRGVKKPTQLSFLNVDRPGFDHWLLSLLPRGVEVVGETALTDFTEDRDGVTISLTGKSGGNVRCNNLVGCDGGRSQVRRALGADNIATYVTLQDYVRIDGEIEPYFDCIYMREIGDCFAYAYVVPKGEVAIVGSVYYPKTKRPHEKQEQILGILRERIPALGESTKREAYIALYLRKRSDVIPAQGRVLLAGEAGGFMSPTSGEGISYALNSGYLAGSAIAASSPESAAEAYRRDSAHIVANIYRKLRFLPFMESDLGKYLAGFVPAPIVSRVTEGL